MPLTNSYFKDDADRLKWVVDEQAKVVREQARKLQNQQLQIDQLNNALKQNGQ